METTHTPGPWAHRRASTPDNTGGFDFAIIDAAGTVIAETFENVGYTEGGCRFDTRPVLANARLIAAAPELLSALQAAHAFIESTGRQLGLSEQMDSAIKKATGKNV